MKPVTGAKPSWQDGGSSESRPCAARPIAVTAKSRLSHFRPICYTSSPMHAEHPSILMFPRAPAAPEPGFDLTVVVPAYNEASRLPRALDGLATWCASQDLAIEVLVVDDGSRDATARAAAAHPLGCGVVRLTHNRGKGAAVRAGMRLGRGRIVAFTDADLPYDLAALRWGCDVIAAGIADVVYGGRDLDGSVESVVRSAARSLASRCFRTITRHLIARDVGDTQCGLKVFRRDAAREIFSRVQTDGFAFDAEAILVARRLGYASARVPVRLVNEAGSTVSLRRHAPAMVRDIVAARLRHGISAGPATAPVPSHEVLQAAAPRVLPGRRAA
jgi:dolichyl-phosphate beta-glucosyltransferase